MFKYIKGDSTNPIQVPALIIHVCNNQGGWGAGFVLALSKKWSEPEKAYRDWYNGKFVVPQIIDSHQFELGSTQFVPILNENIWIANMIAQDKYRKYRKSEHESNHVYLNYDALNKTLTRSYKFAYENNLTIHMPKIGCGFAGGDWNIIEKMIKPLSEKVNTTVYLLE